MRQESGVIPTDERLSVLVLPCNSPVMTGVGVSGVEVFALLVSLNTQNPFCEQIRSRDTVGKAALWRSQDAGKPILPLAGRPERSEEVFSACYLGKVAAILREIHKVAAP